MVRMEKMRGAYMILMGKLEDTGVNGRILLKFIWENINTLWFNLCTI